MMRKIVTLFAAVFAAGAVAFAQGPMGGPPMGGGSMPDFSKMGDFAESMDDLMDAEKQATIKTGKLKDAVGLSDDQYKKVFKIYKQETQFLVNQMQNGMMMGPGPMMGGGSNMMERFQKDDEKTIAARNKKFKKILTPEQFDKYLAWLDQEAIDAEKRAAEMKQKMSDIFGGGNPDGFPGFGPGM